MENELLKAIAVTAELTGTELSKVGIQAIEVELSRYPLADALSALEQCRRELTGRLTLAAILQRLQQSDGHLGPDEAWALCPMSEADTVVWTEEISQAFLCAALPLVEDGDRIAARMAFREAYAKRLAEARAHGKRAIWAPSLGHDTAGREQPIRGAVELGRLTNDQAVKYLPAPPATTHDLAVIAKRLACST